mmetsp:Transcript_5371/g.9589  ORF Transcript_5371/g.9589 Transcript_5371/m.9589 type:complete len:120 (-) Transcript_5371:222-581(-)
MTRFLMAWRCGGRLVMMNGSASPNRAGGEQLLGPASFRIEVFSCVARARVESVNSVRDFSPARHNTATASFAAACLDQSHRPGYLLRRKVFPGLVLKVCGCSEQLRMASAMFVRHVARS